MMVLVRISHHGAAREPQRCGMNRMSDDVQRFDRWSKSYEDCWGQRFFDSVHTAMLDLLAASAPALQPSVVLDVGCGTGRLLRNAAVRWPAARLIGVDPAQGMVEVAQRLTPSGDIRQAFAESLPLGDASVDAALSSISMHHWRDASQGLLEVARVLRPGGLFCLADISFPSWLAKLLRSKGKNRRAIRELLIRSGFAVRSRPTTLWSFVSISVACKREA